MKAVRKVLGVFLAMAREIFDEAAYSRFLASHHTAASRSSYATFLREQEGLKARRPRCC
jgi:hypothetical protein